MSAPKTAWFHCFAGTAGDMSLGALIDAGADPAAVAEIVGALGLDGYALTFEPVLRCGIAATHAVVVVHDHAGEDHDHVDPATGAPDAALTQRVTAAAHAEGVVLLTCGTYGNVIRLLPPLAIGDELLVEGLEVLAGALARS